MWYSQCFFSASSLLTGDRRRFRFRFRFRRGRLGWSLLASSEHGGLYEILKVRGTVGALAASIMDILFAIALAE